MSGVKWTCTAYGPAFPGLCFFSEVRPCEAEAECAPRMAGERVRVFDRIRELDAAGDDLGHFLAGEFTHPDQLLNAEPPLSCGEPNHDWADPTEDGPVTPAGVPSRVRRCRRCLATREADDGQVVDRDVMLDAMLAELWPDQPANVTRQCISDHEFTLLSIAADVAVKLLGGQEDS